MKSIIYLAGFMGSGKSTIGPILANTLGWDFYDLDKIIEQKAGKRIREIFKQKGEKFFRETEKETLKEISLSKQAIVSLGGGTMANEENIKVLKKTGKIVYLKVSKEAAYGRLKFKRDRPALIKSLSDDFTKEELLGRIDDLMNSRTKYYEQADFTIDTDKSTVGKTVDKIVRIISDAGLMQ